MDSFPEFSILVFQMQIHSQSMFVAHAAHFTCFCLESKSLLKKKNREASMLQNKSFFYVNFTSKIYEVQIWLRRHITLKNQKVRRLQPSSLFGSVSLSPLKLKRYTEVAEYSGSSGLGKTEPHPYFAL